MCTNLLKDSRTFSFLQQIDQDTEAQAAQAPCRHCGDRLHRADYERKPRAAAGVLPAGFSRRPSFCCRRDGCRRRQTPALVRFLGRKVYVSILIVLVAAMTQGPSAKRLSTLKRELDIPPRTVKRWLIYWQKTFPGLGSWRYQRGNFMPPIDESDLPLSLLSRLSRSDSGIIPGVLRLIRLASKCSFTPTLNVHSN